MEVCCSILPLFIFLPISYEIYGIFVVKMVSSIVIIEHHLLFLVLAKFFSLPLFKIERRLAYKLKSFVI